MKVIQNATAYILRKRSRTLIIFVIISLVLLCLYICLNIIRSSSNLEKSLYQTSNSSLSITSKDSQGDFDAHQLQNLNSVREISEVVYQYSGLAKLLTGEVINDEQKITRDDLSSDLKNLVAIQATNNSKRDTLFNSGIFALEQGRHLEKNDQDKVLVHSDFAKKNKLKLHDKISLKLANTNHNTSEHQYEIVGIFSGKKHEKYTGLSSDFSENMMFTDYESSQKDLNAVKQKLVNKITLYTDSPEKMDEAIKKIKALKNDWSKYNLEKDDNAFKEALVSLSSIKHIIRMMVYLIMTGSVIVLSLILMLWLRERIYEIGILLSIGMSKIKIMTQFILELVLVSIPAIVVTLIFGSLATKQIISQFANSDDSMSALNLLNNGFSIDSLISLAQSYGILIAIITLSVAFTAGMILIKKPKEILSKIS
ncbi:MAG: FtsX-like permease family protein [Candidatus Saccharibacteria bacterium]|nr:FtsX-like permease family protein [Candidatus Saccharibacteria bacterium]